MRNEIRETLHEVLEKSGGLKAAEATSRVRDSRDWPPELYAPFRQYDHKIDMLIAFERKNLQKAGYLADTDHGVWRLSSLGSAKAKCRAASMIARPACPYQADVRIRRAVEIRGVEVAEETYRARGYVTARRGKPYDLDATRTGAIRHIEAKGLQDPSPAEVILTSGEIEHARKQEVPVDLIVVSGITVVETDDLVVATGGRIHCHIENWIPASTALAPTQYRYRLPEAP